MSECGRQERQKRGDGSLYPHDKELQEGTESNRSGLRDSKENVLGTQRPNFAAIQKLTELTQTGWKDGPACRDEVDRAD